MSFDDECIEIHGIQPKDVIHEKTFDQLWNAIYENHLKGNIMVAHNAKFDMNVLRATLDYYKIPWPELPAYSANSRNSFLFIKSSNSSRFLK